MNAQVQCVYGPVDGTKLQLPDVCPCCGGEVGAGAIFSTTDGHRYVLVPSLGIAVYEPFLERHMREVGS